MGQTMARVFRDSVKREGTFEWYRVHTHLDRDSVRYTISFKVRAKDEQSAVNLATKEYGHAFGNEMPDDFRILKVIT